LSRINLAYMHHHETLGQGRRLIVRVKKYTCESVRICCISEYQCANVLGFHESAKSA
jgi:hypothetical protein